MSLKSFAHAPMVARPRVRAAERQLVVHVHLVPTELVDPNHGPGGLQVVELLPEPRLGGVDRQRGNRGELAGQPAQHVEVRRAEPDLNRLRRRRVMTGVVQHGSPPFSQPRAA